MMTIADCWTSNWLPSVVGTLALALVVLGSVALAKFTFVSGRRDWQGMSWTVGLQTP